jgi:hypothetical protein
MKYTISSDNSDGRWNCDTIKITDQQTNYIILQNIKITSFTYTEISYV